jgi:hypothetical protein
MSVEITGGRLVWPLTPTTPAPKVRGKQGPVAAGLVGISVPHR